MYPPETKDAILARLAEGESLRAICRDEEMPDKATVIRWLDDDTDFATKYAHARVGQADELEADMADIEDQVWKGLLDHQAARVILGSKQWRASKLAPKVYGDKVTQEHTGPNGGPVIQRIENVIVDPK